MCVRDFDNFYGLDSINTPLSHQKIWNSEEVVVGGLNDAIGTDWEDISTLDTDNIYLGGNGISGLCISSTSTGDSYQEYLSVSGGARIVRLYYLDVNWNPQTVDINMSGTATTPIGTDILVPNKLEVVSVGISGEAAGDIYLASGGKKYLKIEQYCNESYNGYYYVPSGKNLMITDASCYPRADNKSSLEFVYKVQEPRVVGSTTNYIEYYKWAGSYKASSSIAMSPNMISPLLVNQKCRIRMRAMADAGSGKAIGYLKGYLVDKK